MLKEMYSVCIMKIKLQKKLTFNISHLDSSHVIITLVTGTWK